MAKKIEVIQARLVHEVEMDDGDLRVRCGACGQAMLWIEGACAGPDSLGCRGPARLKAPNANVGWAYQPEVRVWRPTETHLAIRAASRDRIRAGRSTDRDEAIVVKGILPLSDRFHGKRAPTQHSRYWNPERLPEKSPRFSTGQLHHALTLPQSAECQECHVVNVIEVGQRRT